MANNIEQEKEALRQELKGMIAQGISQDEIIAHRDAKLAEIEGKQTAVQTPGAPVQQEDGIADTASSSAPGSGELPGNEVFDEAGGSEVAPQEPLKDDKEIGGWENLRNNVNNVMNRIYGFDDRLTLAAADVYENLLGKEAADKFWALMPQKDDEGNIIDSTEDARRSAYREIAQLEAQNKQTVGLIDAWENGDAGQVLSAAAGAGLNLFSTLVTSSLTLGAGLYTDMVADAIVDANQTKADKLGISVQELYDRDEEEFAIPAAIGVAGGLLERIGIKGVESYVAKAAAKNISGAAMQMAYNSGTEGFTEWLQTGLEKFNEEKAKGNEEAAGEALEHLFTREGAEAALQGAVGAFVGGAAGKGARKVAPKATGLVTGGLEGLAGVEGRDIQAVKAVKEWLFNPDRADKGYNSVIQTQAENIAKETEAKIAAERDQNIAKGEEERAAQTESARSERSQKKAVATAFKNEYDNTTDPSQQTEEGRLAYTLRGLKQQGGVVTTDEALGLAGTKQRNAVALVTKASIGLRSNEETAALDEISQNIYEASLKYDQTSDIGQKEMLQEFINDEKSKQAEMMADLNRKVLLADPEAVADAIDAAGELQRLTAQEQSAESMEDGAFKSRFLESINEKKNAAYDKGQAARAEIEKSADANNDLVNDDSKFLNQLFDEEYQENDKKTDAIIQEASDLGLIQDPDGDLVVDSTLADGRQVIAGEDGVKEFGKRFGGNFGSKTEAIQAGTKIQQAAKAKGYKAIINYTDVNPERPGGDTSVAVEVYAPRVEPVGESVNKIKGQEQGQVEEGEVDPVQAELDEAAEAVTQEGTKFDEAAGINRKVATVEEKAQPIEDIASKYGYAPAGNNRYVVDSDNANIHAFTNSLRKRGHDISVDDATGIATVTPEGYDFNLTEKGQLRLQQKAAKVGSGPQKSKKQYTRKKKHKGKDIDFNIDESGRAHDAEGKFVPKSQATEVARVKDLPLEAEDGATFNLDGTVYEDGGLVVPVASKNMKASELTNEAIENFKNKYKDYMGSASKVGIYKFPNQDQVSIDLNIIAPSSKREQALQIGKSLGQESLFDLDTFENIKTGETGANPKTITAAQAKSIANRLSDKKFQQTAPGVVDEVKRARGFTQDQLSDQGINPLVKLGKGQKYIKIPLHKAAGQAAELAGGKGGMSSGGDAREAIGKISSGQATQSAADFQKMIQDMYTIGVPNMTDKEIDSALESIRNIARQKRVIASDKDASVTSLSGDNIPGFKEGVSVSHPLGNVSFGLLKGLSDRIGKGIQPSKEMLDKLNSEYDKLMGYEGAHENLDNNFRIGVANELNLPQTTVKKHYSSPQGNRPDQITFKGGSRTVDLPLITKKEPTYEYDSARAAENEKRPRPTIGFPKVEADGTITDPQVQKLQDDISDIRSEMSDVRAKRDADIKAIQDRDGKISRAERESIQDEARGKLRLAKDRIAKLNKKIEKLGIVDREGIRGEVKGSGSITEDFLNKYNKGEISNNDLAKSLVNFVTSQVPYVKSDAKKVDLQGFALGKLAEQIERGNFKNKDVGQVFKKAKAIAKSARTLKRLEEGAPKSVTEDQGILRIAENRFLNEYQFEPTAEQLAEYMDENPVRGKSLSADRIRDIGFDEIAYDAGSREQGTAREKSQTRIAKEAGLDQTTDALLTPKLKDKVDQIAQRLNEQTEAIESDPKFQNLSPRKGARFNEVTKGDKAASKLEKDATLYNQGAQKDISALISADMMKNNFRDIKEILGLSENSWNDLSQQKKRQVKNKLVNNLLGEASLRAGKQTTPSQELDFSIEEGSATRNTDMGVRSKLQVNSHRQPWSQTAKELNKLLGSTNFNNDWVQWSPGQLGNLERGRAKGIPDHVLRELNKQPARVAKLASKYGASLRQDTNNPGVYHIYKPGKIGSKPDFSLTEKQASSQVADPEFVAEMKSMLEKAWPDHKVIFSPKQFNEKVNSLQMSGISAPWSRMKGFVTGNEIYLNPSKVGYDTPIHEFGHVWEKQLQVANPRLWKRGVELLKGSEYARAVYDNPTYRAYLKKSPSKFWGEVMANAIGKRGAVLFSDKKKANTWDKWMNKFGDWIKEKLNISTKKDYKDLTLNDWLDTAVHGTVSGRIPGAKSAFLPGSEVEYSIAREQAAKVANQGPKKGWFKKATDWMVGPAADDYHGLVQRFNQKFGKDPISKKFKEMTKKYVDGYEQYEKDATKARENFKKQGDALAKALGIKPGKLDNELAKDSEVTFAGAPLSYQQALEIYTNPEQYDPGLVDQISNTLPPAMLKFADNLGFSVQGSVQASLLDHINKDVFKDSMSDFLEYKNKNFTEGVLNDLGSKMGEEYQNAIEDSLNRMAGASGRPTDAITQKWNDWLNNSVGAIMFLNVRSAVLQGLSVWNYMSPGNMFAFNRDLGQIISNPNSEQRKMFKELWNDPMLKERRARAGFDVNANEILDAARDGSIGKFTQKALNKGFILTSAMDSFAIAAGGAAFVRQEMKAGKKSKEEAMRAWREKTQEAQQSARPDRVSKQQKAGVSKFILAFANTPAQYFRLSQKAYRTIKAKGLTSPEGMAAARKIAYYMAIQNAIFTMAQSASTALLTGWGGEDDERKEAENALNSMISTGLRGMGLYGAVLSAAKDAVINARRESGKKNPKYSDAIIKGALQVSPPLNRKINQIQGIGRAYTYKQERSKTGIRSPHAVAVGKGGEALFNLPTDWLQKKLAATQALYEGDANLEEFLWMLGGYSEYSVLGKKDKDSLDLGLDLDLDLDDLDLDDLDLDL